VQHVFHSNVLVFGFGGDEGASGEGTGTSAGDGGHDCFLLFVRVYGALWLEVFCEWGIRVDGGSWVLG
jgi:hypothetical protein